MGTTRPKVALKTGRAAKRETTNFTLAFTHGLWIVITRRLLCCAFASERTCRTLVPGRMPAGICACICVGEVEISGIATLLISTHEPPKTAGAGNVSAFVAEARFAPLMVMNDPGLKVVVPS